MVNKFIVFYFVASFLNFGMLFFYNCGVDKKVSLKVTDFQKSKLKLDLLPKSTTNTIVYHEFYTLSYHEKYEQAEWVAYALKKEQVVNSNFKRPYFIQDSKVSSNSADWRNFKKSGYDKGHLCPAADREFDKNAYDETFLTSNISPQNHKFNKGIWNRLEQKIRYWAIKHDELFIITAGVLSPDLNTIGQEKVAVPDCFYKIVLDEYQGKYKMIAFLIPNTASNKPLYEYVVSVDTIEKLTNIDFFPELPNNVENQLERSSNYKEWSFN